MRFSFYTLLLPLAWASPLDAPGELKAKQTTVTSAIPDTTGTLKVTLIADTNRDGKVDLTGDTDIAGKDNWTEKSGALFLANIADTDGRCSARITESTDDNEIDKCHDAEDDQLRNPKYLAPIRTIPNPTLSDSAIGSIAVSNEMAASKVRIFHKDGNNWTYVASGHDISAQHLRAGLELGIDARDVRRPGEWDGRATVEITVKDNAQESKDSVMLRVAPVLTHHHGQKAEQLLTSNGVEYTATGEAKRYPPQDQFVKDLEDISRSVGIENPLHVFNTTDVWAQDFFEPGYSSIPGLDGPVGLRIMIRSSQDRSNRGNASNRVFQFRSSTVGAVQHDVAKGEEDTIESMGNLETIPPYTYKDKSYPAGRAVMGSKDGRNPRMMGFLAAQETQDPIQLNTSWLAVGHTDEFMQFLPIKSDRGWILMVDDPRAGLSILGDAKNAGHGGLKAFSRESRTTDPCGVSNSTIDEVLSRPNFTGIQEYCANAIEENIDIIKRETGITDDEIVRVPSLFDRDHPLVQDCKNASPGEQGGRSSGPPSDRLNRGQAGSALRGPLSILSPKSPAKVGETSAKMEFSALYPGTINGVVLSDTQVLAPNPWGPVIDGNDVFAAAVQAAYAKANYTVLYMDDWFSHHVNAGEVHCGSNTIRDMTAKWW